MKIVAGFFISSLGLGTIAFGQSNENIAELNTKSVSIGRGAAPVIDGQLNEADWTQATLIDDFHQLVPFEMIRVTAYIRLTTSIGLHQM